MPAYLVFICEEVTDRESLETYWSKIGPTLQGHPAKPLAAYTPFESLEGRPVDGVSVHEFPSMEAAKAWYNGPEYRAIRHHRHKGARYIGLLVEGGWVPADQRMPHTKGRVGSNT
ncbi:MAG TPA: DUF1330 domain-containing protein [Steroidobacteraceae bacterium]|nr:DUF1330 domain-containing protein [Steroidobacteraceae bacterium]